MNVFGGLLPTFGDTTGWLLIALVVAYVAVVVMITGGDR